MAKGKSSQNSLKALAYPIQQFMAAWGAKARPSKLEQAGDWPAPYALAAVRGEAVLRSHFFDGFIPKTNITLDAGQQLALWQTLVENGGYITAWVQRLAIAKALRREAVLSADATQEHRALFCILLDALNTQAAHLLPWAVEGYFMHCYKAQFPTAPVAKTSTPQTQVLRDKLIRALKNYYHENVEVKESFKESDDADSNSKVQFSLLIKRASTNQWETMTTLERPRLKTARLAAYEAALKQTTAQTTP